MALQNAVLVVFDQGATHSVQVDHSGLNKRALAITLLPQAVFETVVL